jgi:hypothetical protein
VAAAVIYILCALTSIACAILLLRGYGRTRTRLLLWSGLCFAGLAVNNLLLILDKVITGPETDFSLIRGATAVVALSLMLYGLIWDAE